MPPKSGRARQSAKSRESTKTPARRDDQEEDEDDDRSSDSDFDLEKNAVLDDSEASETHDDGTNDSKRKRTDGTDTSPRKRTKTEEGSEQDEKSSKSRKRAPRPRGKVTFADLDSGDEVTINQGGRRRREGNRNAIIIDEDDEGGEGGWVKTRSQRALEVDDDRPLATTDGATIDVDDVWSRLAALPVGRSLLNNTPIVAVEDEAEFITIKRTTRFAGEITTEEKRVHKNSAEAKLYLQEQENTQKKDEEKQPEDQDAAENNESKPSLRRPLKRLSRFEANPTGDVKALPPHQQLRWPRNKTLEMAIADRSKFTGPMGLPAARINTVDKSRQDWAGFVDKSGIAEELDKYGKSKATYLGRQDFLSRAENHVEQGLRAARQKG